MLTKIFDKATSLVDSRFLLVALFPVLVFVAALALLLNKIGSALPGDISSKWPKWSAWQQWSSAVAAIALLFVVAYLLYISVTPLTRAFEGYIGPIAWLGALFKALGKRRSDDPFAYRKWAATSSPLPSRLGNSLRAAEYHATKAYGLDTVVLWPMLADQLGADTTKRLDASRMTLDFFVVLTFGSSIHAIVGGAIVSVSHGGQGLWLVTVGASTITAYVTYCGAVAAARDYGDQVRTAFDLNRFALISALRYPLPADLAEEKALWSDINELVRSDEPRDWRLYEHPASKG